MSKGGKKGGSARGPNPDEKDGEFQNGLMEKSSWMKKEKNCH